MSSPRSIWISVICFSFDLFVSFTQRFLFIFSTPGINLQRSRRRQNKEKHMIQGLNNKFYRISPCNIGTQFSETHVHSNLVPSQKQVFAPNTLKQTEQLICRKKWKTCISQKDKTKFIRDFIFRHWTYITTLKTTKAFNGEAAATAYF